MKKPGDRWPFQTMRNSGDKGNASENLRGERERGRAAGKRFTGERRRRDKTAFSGDDEEGAGVGGTEERESEKRRGARGGKNGE